MKESRGANTADSMATRPSMLARLRNPSDEATWTDFVQRYRPLLLNFAKRLSLPTEDAEEVCQDVFSEVSQHIGDYKPEAGRQSFRGWLYQRTEWRVMDRFRRRRREIGNTGPHPDDDSKTPLVERLPAAAELEAIWEQEWVKSRMAVALGRLAEKVPAKRFQAFELYELREWPVHRVAQALGMNIATVYVHCHRLRKLLRSELERLAD